MKTLSVLAILLSASLTSCSTKRFSDVVPETHGTELGNVVIGKENADYFIVPSGKPVSGQDESPAQLILFKTKERHPSYRAAHLAGAPVRGVNRVTSTLASGVVNGAGAIVTAPFKQPDPKSYAHEAHGLPTEEPSAPSAPLFGPASAAAATSTASSSNFSNPISNPPYARHTTLNDQHAQNPVRNPMYFQPYY